MVISAIIDMSIEFQITQGMVNSFARLTGDYNSMHMDAEVARKSRFRRTIVHGMLPLSFISLAQHQFSGQKIKFKNLSAHFNKPVFVDDVVILTIKLKEKAGNLSSIRSEWTRKGTGELLLIAKGLIELIDERTTYEFAKSNNTGFLLGQIEENLFTIEDLDGQEELLEFKLNHDLVNEYARSVISMTGNEITQICPNLIMSLLISTMVGMRLPGRYATFSRFKIEFENSIEMGSSYTMVARLAKVSKGAEHIEANVSISDENNKISASGQYEVVLNSPPKMMPACRDICENSLNLGLSGKVALVIGSSRGIGETTAKLFSMMGAKTVVTYLYGKSDAERIVADIKHEGGDAISVQCDITNDKHVSNMVNKVIEHYGSIDILVNNAVKTFSPRDVLDLNWNDYLEELEVSVKGLHACCKEVIPLFKKQGHGKIINLSTVAVANPVTGQSRYITAKSAVEGYTKSLAVELSQYGIQANLVVPNMTDTDLISVIPATFRERIAESRPYSRHVEPIEVAQNIAYLASDWSNAMTGQKIVLNLGEPPFA